MKRPPRRCHRSAGLDQLGPTQAWKTGVKMPDHTGGPRTPFAKARISVSKRNVKITLSTSVMKADDIKD